MLGKIKKLLYSLIGVMMLTLLPAACVERGASDYNYDEAEDSIWICGVVESIVNPEFENVADVLVFRDNTRANYTIDSVFLSMPDEVITNVASVVIKKIGSVNKLSLVSEYLTNNAIYNALPPQAPTQEVDKEATDPGTKSEPEEIVSETQSYRIDTIDGKPVKVKVVKRESYTK